MTHSTEPTMTEGDSPDHLLVLMRHAKSDWADETLSDHQRPLNARGRAAAPQMADWLTGVDAVPDIILCSSAARTRETVALMLPRWDQPPQVIHSDALYLASPEVIVRAVRSDSCGLHRVMVVAHNPGVGQLVGMLSGEPTEMPTAATAVFDVSVPQWQRLGIQSPARLAQFMRPKAL